MFAVRTHKGRLHQQQTVAPLQNRADGSLPGCLHSLTPSFPIALAAAVGTRGCADDTP